MSTPKLSVLVPVHNGEALLGQVVRNILLQTLTPTTVEFLDDGSTDGTWSRLQEEARVLREAGIEVVARRFPENRGRGKARNALLHESDADVVAWFDVDDLWHPTKLELQMAAWRQLTGEARARTVLYCDYQIFHGGSGSGRGRAVRLPEEMTMESLLSIDGRFRTIQLQTTFGSRQAFLLGGGFLEDLNYGEDLAFALAHVSSGGVLLKCRDMGDESVLYFQNLKRVDIGAIHEAQDRVCKKFRSCFEALGIDVGAYLAEKRLRYNFNACLIQRDFAAARAIIADASRWRKLYAIRELLPRQVGRLREAEETPSRAIEEMSIEHAKDCDKAKEIVLEGIGSRGYVIGVRQAAAGEGKVVIEWRGHNDAVLSAARYGERCRRVFVSTEEILLQYLSGARKLKVKSISKAGSATRTFRCRRNESGSIQLK